MSSGDIEYVVSTGYGRTKARNSVANEEVTEITAQCRDISAPVPDVDLVIDIGDQDTKSFAMTATEVSTTSGSTKSVLPGPAGSSKCSSTR